MTALRLADHIGHSLLSLLVGMIYAVLLGVANSGKYHESVEILCVLIVVFTYLYLLVDFFQQLWNWNNHAAINAVLAAICITIPILITKLLS